MGSYGESWSRDLYRIGPRQSGAAANARKGHERTASRHVLNPGARGA
jgi:hypothetical protein